MKQPIHLSRPFRRGVTPAVLTLLAVLSGAAAAAELSVDDFRFDGPLGSHGAQIERVGPNHFHITLGHAPNQPKWCNMLYFHVPGNGSYWNNGPHLQFGITTVLCEGSGDWTDKQGSLDAGAALMKTLADYYHGTRAASE